MFDVDEPADHLGKQDEQPTQPTNAAVMLMIIIIMTMAAHSRRKEEDSDETKGTWKKAEAKASQSNIHKHLQNENELWTICCGEEIDVEVNVLDQKKENPKILGLRRGITIDSGAGNSAMPRRMVVDQSSIRESAGSKAGVHYVAANDGRIPNEGECDLEFQTAEGNDEDWTFQVAEVNKALGAVSSLVDKGYKVIFEKDMSTGQDLSMMINKNTRVTSRFRRVRNVWVLDAFINSRGQANASRASLDFARRGRA